MLLTTAALIGAGVAAAGGAIGGAVNRSKAKNTMNSWYDYAEDYARTQANTSVFDTAGGKALLKLSGRNAADNLDAINNMMVAGGGTMENALAARQSNNEARDKVNMQLLQADQNRRENWDRQLLNYKGQRADYNANSYMQAAQDWNQWGGQMASSLLSLGSTGLLGGAGSIGGAASAVAAGINPADVAGSGANVFNSAVAASQVPQINYAPVPKALGGLGDLTRHGKA